MKPEIRWASEAQITPRSIMTHHSGLPSDYLKGMWTRNPEPFIRVADRVRDEYAANPPGTVFSYSNLIRIEELDGIGISRADVAGREILTARMLGREFPIGERMRPVPVPAQWLGRAGEYEIANPGEDAVLPEKVRLRADGGVLFVEYSIPVLFPGTASFAVAPVSETEAIIRGIGRGMGETVRAVTVNGENMLSYSGYLLREKRK